MLLIPLIVVGFSIIGVDSRSPFNFRGTCYVRHMKNTFSANCDGNSKHIMSKDLFLDNRTTASMSEMGLTNFENVTLDASVEVQRIKISNTSRVSLFVSNLNLKELVVDSVDELTLKHEGLTGTITKWMDRMLLTKVNRLQLINEREGKILWLVNTVNIINVNDFPVESLQFHINATNVSMKNTQIRLKSKSSFLLEANSASITDGNIYLHDAGDFSIKVDGFSVADSKIDLENGTIRLLKSHTVTFVRNSFYVSQNKSLLLNGYSNVEFDNNDIFTNDIVDFLNLKHGNIVFKNNNFGCTDCSIKDKLLTVDLKDTGDINYCYTDCKLSLNKYKEHLHDYCVCGKGESTVELSALCAHCAVKNETGFFCEYISADLIWWAILFVIILVIVIISFLCCVCYKGNINKWKLLFMSDIHPKKMECELGDGDSQAVIFRKPKNYDDDDGYNGN